MRLILPVLAGWAAWAQSEAPKQTRRDLEITEVASKDRAAVKASVAGKRVTIPRSHALIIAVGTYQALKPEENLRFAERDADAMYATLISTEGGNFPAENVHRLVGPKATLANIRRELEEWLPAVTQDEDRVLVYFAGHGFIAPDRQAYLAPYDLKREDIEHTGYPMARLGEVFAHRVKGKWKVLLADACHSGAIAPDTARQLNASFIDLSKSMFVLTASRDREVSYESPELGGGHGVFTYFVERGLGGAADADQDAVVTADELAEYVRANVRETTQNRQTPTSDKGSFDPAMLLAFVGTHTKLEEPGEARFGDLVIEANMDGVEVWLDGKNVGVVGRNQPLKLAGLVPGKHLVQGVKLGYLPDGPREEIVYPGQETTVSLRIRFPRQRKKAAVEEFERGLRDYRDAGYRAAIRRFEAALRADATHAPAALYLARSLDALREAGAARPYFEQALRIDPDFAEARVSYGGSLLNLGAYDEAIRQFEAVLARDRRHHFALQQLAAAYRLKANPASLALGIEAAETAVKLKPEIAEPWLWLAECQRLNGQPAAARESYRRYLDSSQFDSRLSGQLSYWVRGFLIGGGRKTRASQADIWRDLRQMAWFGLCDCDRLLGQRASAIAHCRKALALDAGDPYIHYLLGQLLGAQARDENKVELVASSALHFRRMLDLNPDLEEAPAARRVLESYQKLLSARSEP